MIQDLPTIVDLMRNNNTPYFSLKVFADAFSPNGINAGSTTGSSAPDMNVDGAIEELNKKVSLFCKSGTNPVFEIQLYKSKTANGAAILGPFRFQKIVQAEIVPGNQGIGMVPNQSSGDLLGRVNEMIQANNSLIEPRIKLAQDQAQLKHNEERLLQDRAVFEKEKEDLKRELKELEEKFNSRSESGYEALQKFFDNNIHWLGRIKIGGKNAVNLSGVQEEQTSEPWEQKIESIAENIANYYGQEIISEEDIIAVGIEVQRILEKYEKN